MDTNDLQNRFAYHKPKPGQLDDYKQIRDDVYAVALLIDDLCPDSREKSLAITKLEEAVFWANASIARNNSLYQGKAPSI